jgi:hypothetical protein
LSIDCFLDSRDESGEETTDTGFKVFWQKMIIYAILPVLLALVSYTFWRLYAAYRKLDVVPYSRAISTLVILLFLVHPNIVEYMFNGFYCVDIDGEQRIQEDLRVECWQTEHKIFGFFLAMPAIIVWGLGIPFFAFSLLTRERESLNKLSVKEKFGFLYNGYKVEYYYWEIVIMYRKIGLIFIQVFISQNGAITQAMIVLLVLIIFIVINLKKKPFMTVVLNDLETMSLVTSMVTVYCGIFYISNTDTKYIEDYPELQQTALVLSTAAGIFLFMLILIVNVIFFASWLFHMYLELKAKFRKKAEKIYLTIFLCGNKKRLEEEKRHHAIMEENEILREEYFKYVENLGKLYDRKVVVLNKSILERTKAYLNEDRFLAALGISREELLGLQDIKRQARLMDAAGINERA